VVHNWGGRYHPLIAPCHQQLHVSELWQDLERMLPLMLVCGGRSAFVADDDVAVALRLGPGARVDVMERSGHAAQRSDVVRLAGLTRDVIAATEAPRGAGVLCCRSAAHAGPTDGPSLNVGQPESHRVAADDRWAGDIDGMCVNQVHEESRVLSERFGHLADAIEHLGECFAEFGRVAR
jgi:hypothetical protein